MKPLNDWKLSDGVWYKLYCTGYDNDGEEVHEWKREDITVIPGMCLIREWEKLVMELSNKEVELYNMKEAYLIAESKIVNETDFKALYGANNQKVRDNHVKSELSDMVSSMKTLEFSMNWIRNYIPLLKEVIRWKSDNVPSINAPAPILLDAPQMNSKEIEQTIIKALKDCKQ